ncbi:MAG: hypothetical protein IPF92_16935 [Myxococcales bacterium]|nr:hypothetical protein [Myxococcales bacterium]MBL0195488.1 hypothetical protein [Myxococcales bacterium]HQY61698.1 hypothetical protein [Polyangiaceae bacterium]
MPTFLVTSRMSPALAARVEASVTGRSSSPRAAGRRLVALARFVGLGVVAFAVVSLVAARRRAGSELEIARAALLADVRAHAASLTPAEHELPTRISPWIVAGAGAYAGDLVDPELRAPGALEARLAEPTVYVRGAQPTLTTPRGVVEAARASAKDALLLCLVEPPSASTEKVMLGRVRVAYTGGAEARTPRVRRLGDAHVGLPFLAPAWERRVLEAESPRALRDLRRDLERAPLASAKAAAQARWLLFAIDEPGHGAGPTEIDGERAHAIRLSLLEVSTGRVLLRLRREVDPSGFTEAARVQFASGLDSCRFALDVLEATHKPSQYN